MIPWMTAEMVEYVDNSWHALNLGFATEIGISARESAVTVMKIFTEDRKVKI